MAPGCRLLFSPLLFFLKLFPKALPSPASQAVPGEPARTPDRAGLAPGRWLEAGSRCPTVTGSEPGLWDSSSAYLVPWECFFSLFFTLFFILPAVRGAFSSGIPSQPHPAAGLLLLGEERKTEGTWNAIACHPTMLSLTRPFYSKVSAGLYQLIPLYNQGESIPCLI